MRPEDSTAVGLKICVRTGTEYIATLRSAASSAAEPAFLAEASTYESANGQIAVTSQESGLPSFHGSIVSPSGGPLAV